MTPTISTDYVSPSCLRITGYKQEEFYNNPNLGLEMIHPDDRDYFFEHLTSDNGKDREPITIRLVRKNGQVIWIEQTHATILNDRGEPVARHLIARDVTGRIKGEAALRESEEKFHKAFRSSPEPMSITSLEDDRFIEVNESFLRIHDITRKEVIGKKATDLETWVDNGQRERIVQKLENGDQVYNEEIQFLVKGGEIRTSLYSAELIDISGEPCMISIGTDITERKQSEKALKESEERYRRIFNNSAVALWEMDFSKVREYIKELKKKGMKNLQEHITGNPELIEELCSRIELLDVNEMTLSIFKAATKEELCNSFGKLLTDSSAMSFVRCLQDFDAGTLYYNGEQHHKTLEGEDIIVDLTTRISPGSEETWDRVLITINEITERKQAEETLRESEANLARAQEVAHLGNWDWDVKGETLIWSDEIYRIFGVEREFELTYEGIGAMVKPDDREKNREFVNKILSTADFAETEFRVIKADGSERYIYQNAQVRRDKAGNASKIFGIMQDITERKRAEEALRESEEKFSKAFNTNPDAIVISRIREGTILEVNDAWESIMGYSREEVLGKTPDALNLLSPSNRQLGISLLEKQGMIREFDLEFKRKSGDLRQARLSVGRIEIGKVPCMLTIVRDITVRKQMEEALRESEEKLRLMYESVTEGITVTDLDGIIIDMNEATLHIHGCKNKKQLIGRRAFELIAERDRAKAKEGLKKTLERGSSGIIEYALLREDGSEFPGEINTSLIRDTSGNPVSFVAITRDVTERRLLEDELLRATKLESLGTLAGGIAHDFNNLLTGIMGNIGIAKRYTKPENKSFEGLDEAEKAAIRAKDLTQQLLTFARGGTPVKKLSSLPELIDEAATFALRGANVKHDLSLADDLWAIEIDEGQISQVIHNIIVNADEAMPSGGIVHISLVNEVIKSQGVLPLPEGNYLKIEVKDEGIGMSPAQLPRIFEPYYTTKQKGSGLGLATAYAIIKNHGGYITAESGPRTGSTFHIYLPASEKSPPKQRDVVKQDPAMGKGKILVMDDEEIIREMLGKMLPMAGYQVELTGDGTGAISKYIEARDSGKPFDAIIMDLTIPGGMGGKEAIKELLKIDPRVKVIVSSGYATDPIMADYRKYGFSAVITKPYSVSQMEETLHGVLEGKK